MRPLFWWCSHPVDIPVLQFCTPTGCGECACLVLTVDAAVQRDVESVFNGRRSGSELLKLAPPASLPILVLVFCKVWPRCLSRTKNCSFAATVAWPTVMLSHHISRLRKATDFVTMPLWGRTASPSNWDSSLTRAICARTASNRVKKQAGSIVGIICYSQTDT